MPLTAIVDGKTVLGPELSDAEWEDLRRRHRNGLPVTMRCCGAPGHLRKSKNGVRHFYHAVDTGCNYQEESKEHLAIKYAIYQICRSAGWEAYVERPAPDRTWISDVCAEKDGRTVAFEVQVSAIASEELEERDRKYRDAGIESYWLLDDFLGRGRLFAGWYDAYVDEEDQRRKEPAPYIDRSLFATGPENHLFITKGIRSVGLHAKKPAVYTTHNPAITLQDWVANVLNGRYGQYLDDTAAAIRYRRQLKDAAAPSLLRFRTFYDRIVRDGTYRKELDRYNRIQKTGAASRLKEVGEMLGALDAELDWLENEYRRYTSESFGLFRWEKIPGSGAQRPFFRLESEHKIRQLEDCVTTLGRWEESYNRALCRLEQEFPAGKRGSKDRH